MTYQVKKKNSYEALQCFKKFVYSFGKCNTLHTDNGLEFKNNLTFLSLYMNIYSSTTINKEK